MVLDASRSPSHILFKIMTSQQEPDPPEVSAEVQRKARRTIWILYGVMAFLVLLPFVMLFFR